MQNREVRYAVTRERNTLLPVGRDGRAINENRAIKQILHDYLKDTPPKYYPPVENLLDLIYEYYTENKGVAPKTTEAGRYAKKKEKELEAWLKEQDGMDRLVEDYGGEIPMWEKIMDKQGSVCCAWEKTSFEEGLKVGIRLMVEVYEQI